MKNEEIYKKIEWPDIQDYMEEDWFKEEAILSDNSSYFVPIKRLYDN